MGSAKLIDYSKLKQIVPITAVAGHYELSLEEKGIQLVGDCPLCSDGSEETERFKISPAMNGWKCFACGEHGNILDLVSKIEGISVQKASLKIAKWFDIDDCYLGQKTPVTIKSPKKKKKKAKLQSSSIAKDGITEKGSADRKKQGSTLTENEPLNFALKNLDPDHELIHSAGISSDILRSIHGGFCSSGSMSGRLALPYYNREDQLIGYCGIDLDGSHDTQLKFPPADKFNPGIELFNLNFALSRLVMLDSTQLCVVRDPLDALHLASLGACVVASVQEQLTPDQISTICSLNLRYVNFIYNSLDEIVCGEILPIATTCWVKVVCNPDEKPIKDWGLDDLDTE